MEPTNWNIFLWHFAISVFVFSLLHRYLLSFLLLLGRAECLTSGDDGGMGAMRKEAERRQSLAGKGQTDAGLAAEQETALEGSTVAEGENAGRRDDPKDQDQHVHREVAGAFPFGSHRIARCRPQQRRTHRAAGRPLVRDQSAIENTGSGRHPA